MRFALGHEFLEGKTDKGSRTILNCVICLNFDHLWFEKGLWLKAYGFLIYSFLFRIYVEEKVISYITYFYIMFLARALGNILDQHQHLYLIPIKSYKQKRTSLFDLMTFPGVTYVKLHRGHQQ